MNTKSRKTSYRRRSYSPKRTNSKRRNSKRSIRHSNSASSSINKSKHDAIKLIRDLRSKKLKPNPVNKYTDSQIKFMVSNMPEDIKFIIRNEIARKDDLASLIKEKNVRDILYYGELILDKYNEKILKLEKIGNFFRDKGLKFNQSNIDEYNKKYKLTVGTLILEKNFNEEFTNYVRSIYDSEPLISLILKSNNKDRFYYIIDMKYEILDRLKKLHDLSTKLVVK